MFERLIFRSDMRVANAGNTLVRDYIGCAVRNDWFALTSQENLYGECPAGPQVFDPVMLVADRIGCLGQGGA